MIKNHRIGDKIRAAREKRGLRPAEMARLIRMSRQNYYDLERRTNVTTKMLTRIAWALHTTEAEILADDRARNAD